MHFWMLQLAASALQTAALETPAVQPVSVPAAGPHSATSLSLLQDAAVTFCQPSQVLVVHMGTILADGSKTRTASSLTRAILWHSSPTSDVQIASILATGTGTSTAPFPSASCAARHWLFAEVASFCCADDQRAGLGRHQPHSAIPHSLLQSQNGWPLM